VRVTVRDHGHGIPEEFLDRIFKKFSQADSSDTRQKGGTGLGLFITRELVERMAGKIGFESTENQGTCFYVDLPISETQHSNTDAAPLSADKNGPRILVVEDEPDIAKLISIMLNRAGYTVDIALNGKQALEFINHTPYVAMTLDLMLPDISGLELIHLIRNQPGTKDLPIVVVSAKMEEGRLAINGVFSDIDWHAKPIDEAHLLSAVGKYLPEASTHRHRVLHVEDDDDLHQVIRAMSGDRFDFLHAETLREARKQLREGKFDLIILDISLPDGSGWNLLPEIRMQQPQARVIILSGANTTPDEAHKVEAVLLKSLISSKDLLQAINSNIQLPIHK
jgi:DNA-binding response OmpR family regulator